MTVPASVTIAIVSASQSKTSRSRLAARQAQHLLRQQDANVDLIDLQDLTIPPYPHGYGDEALADLTKRFNAADGWVLAVPVYNWGPSGVLLNFLHYALNDQPEQRYRPFVLLGGAGGQRSFLALDGVARTLIHEVSAVQVGPPILAAGDEADTERSHLHPDLQRRIERAVSALRRFAMASPAYQA